MPESVQNKLAETSEGRVLIWLKLLEQNPKMEKAALAGVGRELKGWSN